MEQRLDKFAQLVDAGSFTKAAAKLHISQPALTTAIQKLERELHAGLLVRNGHSFSVTSAGKAAYKAAKDIGLHSANLKLQLQELANEKSVLNLGMIDSVADLLFVHEDNLPELEQGTRLSLVVDNSSQLIRYVEHDDLDVAFIAHPATLPYTLTADPLGNEPLVLVTQAAYLTETQADIQQGILHHFLGYNQNSQTYKLIARHLTAAHITAYPTFYSTNPEIMLQLLLAHRATAILPYLLVRPHLAQGTLSKVDIGPTRTISRPIASIHRTGRTTGKQVSALESRAKQLLSLLASEAII
jgi:DNA-binding transcriptional LysR family regulator